MSGADELLERLTHRLRVDPELRLEITQELRAHLADSAAEYQAGGCDEQQAMSEAVNHLGDADELATQLWQANRRRIRLRNVARWAGRITLMPAAVVLIALVLAPSLVTWDSYGALDHRRDDSDVFTTFKIFGSWMLDAIGRLGEAGPPYRRLSEEDQFLFTGGEKRLGEYEVARRIAERWPDDPVFFAYYLEQALYGGHFRRTIPQDEQAQLFQRGRALDPNDAFYDFLEAAALFQRSTTLRRDTLSTSPPIHIDRVAVTDAETHDTALRLVRQGLAKPRWMAPSFEMLRRRLDVLPPASTLMSLHSRMGLDSLGWSVANTYGCGSRTSAAALAFAEAGDIDRALELLDDLVRLNTKAGAWGREIWHVYYGQLSAIAHRAEVHRIAGHDALAAEWKDRLPELHALYRNTFAQGSAVYHKGLPVARQGFLSEPILRTLDVRNVDTRTLLTAEHAIADRAFLAIVVSVLLVIALCMGLTTCARVAQHRKSDASRPMFLFIGWRRIGAVIVLALLAPVVIYGVYCYAPPIAARAQGLRVIWPRQFVEYALLGTVMGAGVLALSVQAVRRRSEEAGLAVPKQRRRINRVLCWVIPAMVVAVALVYEIGWRISPPDTFLIPDALRRWGVALTVVIPLGGLVWCRLYVHTWGGGPDGWRAMMVRSVGPIVLIAAVVLGLGGGLASWAAERHAVRAFDEVADKLLRTHPRDTDHREVWKQMVEAHEKLLAEWHAKHGT